MSGELHLIIGPMFSSKSSYLISKYNIYKLKYNCMLINSTFDTRYDKSSIVTHNQQKVKSIMLENLFDIDKNLYNYNKVFFIDESQFFTDLKPFILKAIEEDNKIVFIAGLNGDFDRNKFGQILDLIPYNDTLTYLKGICNHCKELTPSIFTYRLNNNSNQILVGNSNIYLSLCRKHYLIAKNQ